MIAILVLTYNNLESTKECIEKIYANTKSEFTLIVLDNNSTDSTVDYLSSLEYDNIKVYSQKANEGIIKGRNKLWYLSFGIFDYDYICFLDNDQFVQDGWDDAYLELMKDYDIVGTEAWQMRYNFHPYRRIKDESEHFSYVGCGGMMIRREVIEDIGLFDEEFNPKYFEDPDFCFRAIKKGYKIGWCVDKVIEHQKHDLTLSTMERVFFMRNLRIIQKKYRDFPLPKIKNEGNNHGQRKS
jgi:GT2 family glycosyltransferase